jgi:hypothetical protein
VIDLIQFKPKKGMENEIFFSFINTVEALAKM